MALIACPECGKQVSRQAPTCPHCGYPIAGPPPAPEPQRIVVQQAPPRGSGGGCALLLILLIGAGIAAAATKPNEEAMKKALVDKHGVLFAVGAGIGEALGTAKYTYHDYVVFSTMTMEVTAIPQRTIAYGYFGHVQVVSP
jgi:hypothetical protein